MPTLRALSGIYTVPSGRLSVRRTHPFASGLRSLWFPGQGGNRLLNFAPDQQVLNPFMTPANASNCPVPTTGQSGPMSYHDGSSGGGYYRSTTPSWTGGIAGAVSNSATIACLLTPLGGPTGYPSYYGFSESAGVTYFGYTLDGTNLLFSIGYHNSGGAEFSFGAWTAGHTYLAIGTTRALNDHQCIAINLTTGARMSASSTTSINGSGLSTQYENIGGANYGSDYYLNGRVGMAACWGRGMLEGEMLAFLAAPFDMLAPSTDRPRGYAVGSAGYTLTAGTGSFALAGGNAGLQVARKLTADAGAFTLAGSAVNLPIGRTMAAATGAFTLSGGDVGLLWSRVMPAGVGAFTLSGSDAGLTRGLLLSAGTGAFTITGADAVLTYSSVSAYTLTAGSGSFTLSGADAGLTVARRLAAGVGAFAETGSDAGLLVGRRLAADAGSYVLTGQAAGFLRGLRLVADSASYALTGSDASLTYEAVGSYVLTADAGAFSLTGSDAGLTVSRLLGAASGSFTLTGMDAGLSIAGPAAYTLTAGAGTFVLTGVDVSLVYRSLAIVSRALTRRILAEDGAHLLTEDGRGIMLESWLPPEPVLSRMVRFGRPRVVEFGRPHPVQFGRPLPVRITGPMSASAPYRWEDKDPADIWPYSADFTGWCAAAGETASSLDVTVAPSGLDLGAWTVTPEGMAAIELGGGTAGVDYAVTVKLTTVSARVLERTIRIKVRER